MKESQVIEIMNKIREYGREQIDMYATGDYPVTCMRHYDNGLALLNEIREALRDA